MTFVKWLITGLSMVGIGTVLTKQPLPIFLLGLTGAGIGGYIVGNIVEDTQG